MRNRKPVFFEAPSEGEPQPARGAAGSADAPRLHDDLPDETSDGPIALRASADPVLAELWDNPADAAYDDLLTS